ncbi:MAG: protease inhibitor I42 family protein [Phormidium sp.]
MSLSILIPIILAMVLEFHLGVTSYLNTPKVALMVDHVKRIERKTVSQLTITQTDRDKTFTVHRGDVIVITLAENSSTGYSWAIDKIDSNIIELQSSEFSLPQNAGVGGGGERILTFRAKAIGLTRLQLKEWRPWEGERSIVQQFNLTLQVKE